MIERILLKRLKEAAQGYPVVAVVGPRQSGKTTLVKATFPQMPYVSLETPDDRAFALDDPRRFLNQFPDGAIIDEVQRVPELFSYIQTIVDQRDKPGMFVLTGSQNFALTEKITQSLAGRVSMHTLLPLATAELRHAGQEPALLDELLFNGCYPRLYDKGLAPTAWLANYVQTYIERDVRQLRNIGDLATFDRFVRMCAARTGQLLNLSALGDDCGINHNTAKAWISILEASFILFRLPPHHRNFNKRLRKSPKLYFYDSGLACYLLGVRRAEELAIHPSRGALFETFIMSELRKRQLNEGLFSTLHFWQDKLGREVDCLIDRGLELTPVEIKAGQTISDDYFKNLEYWNRLAGNDPSNAYLIYAGRDSSQRKQAHVLSWHDLADVPL